MARVNARTSLPRQPANGWVHRAVTVAPSRGARTCGNYLDAWGYSNETGSVQRSRNPQRELLHCRRLKEVRITQGTLIWLCNHVYKDCLAPRRCNKYQIDTIPITMAPPVSVQRKWSPDLDRFQTKTLSHPSMGRTEPRFNKARLHTRLSDRLSNHQGQPVSTCKPRLLDSQRQARDPIQKKVLPLQEVSLITHNRSDSANDAPKANRH